MGLNIENKIKLADRLWRFGVELAQADVQ